MSAELVIDQIRKLSPEEVEKVGEFLEDYRAELQADITAAKRDQEIESGEAKPLSEEDVFNRLRSRLA